MLTDQGMLSMNVSDPVTVFHNHRHDPSSTTVQSASASNLPQRQITVTWTSTSTPAGPTPTLTSSMGPVASSMLFMAQSLNDTTSAITSLPQSYVWPFNVFFGLVMAFVLTSIALPFIGPSLLRGTLRPLRRVHKS